jgi:hypothetical protein
MNRRVETAGSAHVVISIAIYQSHRQSGALMKSSRPFAADVKNSLRKVFSFWQDSKLKRKHKI